MAQTAGWQLRPVAREPVGPQRRRPDEMVAYLRSLPSLWADSGPDGRRALASAIFARTDVLGFQRLEYQLTPDAVELGLDAAMPAVFEVGSKIGEFGRGERRQTSTTDLSVPASLPLEIAITGIERWVSQLDRGIPI